MTGAMGSCRYADDDAVYVLGALEPAEQQAFRAHLPACGRCRAAVEELTVMPGLLARVLPRHGDGVGIDGVRGNGVRGDGARAAAVPPPLLPALLDRVGARRRWSRWRERAAGFLFAAALALVALLLVPGAVPSQAPVQAERELTMSAAPGVAVQATLLVTGRGWGTSIDTRCRYHGAGPAASGAAPIYELYAVDSTGGEVLVSSWRQLAGQEITVPGSTRLGLADIDRLEVRTEAGRVLLTSTP